MNPTVILVHGAFAESSSWDDVVRRVIGNHHRVIAFANPLRSLHGDAAHLTELVKTIDGPIVLAGHSYGGAVITNVPAEAGEVVGLVYVAAFALEAGESAGDASSLVPGRDTGRDDRNCPSPRRRGRPVHRPGEVPRAVLRGRARGQGDPDVGHATAGHRRCAV